MVFTRQKKKEGKREEKTLVPEAIKIDGYTQRPSLKFRCFKSFMLILFFQRETSQLTCLKISQNALQAEDKYFTSFLDTIKGAEPSSPSAPQPSEALRVTVSRISLLKRKGSIKKHERQLQKN